MTPPATVAAPAAAPPVAPAAPLVPFVQGAHEHIEAAFTVGALVPGANGVEHGPFDVPAYGYIRHIMLEVEATGGTLGAGVLAADYPWNLFERITLSDVNGSPIFELDGWATLWANIAGGYAFEQDPRLVDYDGTINTRFYLRIPVEINHFDGLGAISNQNSAASYKVTLRTRPSAQLYTTAPTTIPTFTIRGYLEAWSLPNEVDAVGRPQEQKPPLHGTSQYWSSNSKATIAGANTLQITKQGNMIRNIIFIARNAAGARIDSAFFDPVTFQWDQNNLYQESQRGHTIRLEEKLHRVNRDTGVFAYFFAHSDQNRNGDGPPNLWLPTVQSTRMELAGNIVTAGSIQVVMNDIAPVEINPPDRYETPNRTGFAPNPDRR